MYEDVISIIYLLFILTALPMFMLRSISHCTDPRWRRSIVTWKASKYTRKISPLGLW